MSQHRKQIIRRGVNDPILLEYVKALCDLTNGLLQYHHESAS